MGSSNPQALISGNTVANLNNNYAGTASTGQIRGIVTSSGVNTITVTGNTIRNLTTTSQNPGGAATASVLGISVTSNTAGQTISKNVVHSLASTAASANVNVIGIYYTCTTTTGPNVIARNVVQSLSVASTGTVSSLNGMYFNAGTFTAQNNMVRVGFDGSGASTAGAATVWGIVDNVTVGARNIYHNSVYLGGMQTSGASNTFAFSRDRKSVV